MTSRNCVHRSSPNWVCSVVTISSWLNFGRPAPPGKGSAAGRNLWLLLTTASAQCLRLSGRVFFSFTAYLIYFTAVFYLYSWAYPWVDRGDMSLLLFEVEGTPCVLSPYFLGVDIVCNAQHWLHLHTSQFSFACCYLLLDSVSILQPLLVPWVQCDWSFRLLSAKT